MDNKTIVTNIKKQIFALQEENKKLKEQINSGTMSREHVIKLQDTVNTSEVIKELETLNEQMTILSDSTDKASMVYLDAIQKLINKISVQYQALETCITDQPTNVIKQLQVIEKTINRIALDEGSEQRRMIQALKDSKTPFPVQALSNAIARVLIPLIDRMPKIVWPKDAKDAIAVRLSDGEKFYEAVTQVFGGGSGGGGTPKVDLNGQESVPIASGLYLPHYDFVSLSIAGATETYTFKLKNSTVATVVIVYTDSTRADISTVTRT